MIESRDSFDGTIHYNSECSTYQTKFDPDSDSSSAVIAEAIAAIEGRDAKNLEPLYQSFDSDALDRLIESTDNKKESIIDIEFTTNGYEITVSSEGTILLQPEE